MNKWKAIQAGVISSVVVVTGVEVLGRNPGDNPHTANTASAQDQQIGRDAIEKVATTGTVPPLVNTMGGDERRRYYPNASAFFSSQGETGPPLTMGFLS